MNSIQKLKLEKLTENGDKAYSSTGNNEVDLVFLAEYLSKHIKEATIGTSEREQLLAMFIRDPRFGLGYKDLGRRLMHLSGVTPELMLEVGRADDLWEIATDECLNLLYSEAKAGNNLVKKWLPSLTGRDKNIANALRKEWKLTPKEYRELKKTDSTVEYKLSYHETKPATNPLEEAFDKVEVFHPLVDGINFEQVPSLAMHKYLRTFSTREDIKDRYADYLKALKEGKAKVNTATATVHDAAKTVQLNSLQTKEVQDAAEVIAKKTVEANVEGVALNALVILDSSGSMGYLSNPDSLISKATSVAHALAMKSTYCPGELIAFSERPHFIKIKGETLQEQYKSMQTGEVANTDFGKVMKLCSKLSTFPEYLICLSDMEFDEGSVKNYWDFRNTTAEKHKADVMKEIHDVSPNTKVIWWNFSDRNATSPELDEYGNIFLSGYNLQILKFLNAGFDMTMFLNKVLEEYKNSLNKQLKANGKTELN